MSNQNQNRPQPIGNAFGKYAEFDGKQTKLEIKLHEPDQGPNGLRFRTSVKQQFADGTEKVTWGSAFSNVIGQNKDRVVFNVTTVARHPGPRTDEQGNFLDANGSIVQSEQEAQTVMKPMINPKTNRPVYIPLAKIFTADFSKNNKPYPQTMFTGKVYTQEEGLNIARQDVGAASARGNGNTEKADAHARESDRLQKETGSYFSIFPDANMLNQLGALFNIQVNMPKPKVQNNQGAPVPSGP